MTIRAAIVGFLLPWLSLAAPPADAQPTAAARRSLAGQPLADALRYLQGQGLPVVFSSELVRPAMRVRSEPAGLTNRQILDALLKDHGLEARPGPGGRLIVVRAVPRPASPSAAARQGATIRGVVVDAKSATPLKGALVRVSASPGECLTGDEGQFEISGVPAGRHTLFASLVGYTLARPAIDVVSGATLDITISLADGTATYDEQVIVTADVFRATDPSVPSVLVLNGADLLQLRGVLADDPLRAVQALPAVGSANDFRSEFSVRGADYGHVGLSVDGMTTDWPIHTVRDDMGGGSVSLINSDVVDRVALFSGAYPQDRPGRTGAWVDFSIREGSRARLQARGAMTMTSASLILEGPIGRARGSWLVATRQSYLQWILRRMDSAGTTFGYADVQGKAVYDLRPAQRLDLTVIAGRSQLDLQRQDTDPNLIGRGLADAFLATAGWRAVRGAGLTLSQRVSVSRYGFENYRIDAVPLGAGIGTSWAYRASAAWTAGPSLLVQAGAHVQRDAADNASVRFIERPPAATIPRPQAVDASRSLGSADVRTSYTAAGGFSVDGGVLVSRATNDASGVLASPWAGLVIPIRGLLSFRAGAGVYRQHAAIDQTSGTFGGDGVVAERAGQFEAGLEHRWSPNLRVQAMVYRRRDRDMLRLEDDEYRLAGGSVQPPSLEPRWVNALDGTASGLEIIAQRRAARGLSGWVGYTYAKTRQHDRLTGERFVADFDQRHMVSLYAHYRVSPVTSVNARVRMATNVPIPGYVDSRDGGLFVGSDRNGVRLKPYARVDLRANRAFNFETRRLTLFVELVNLLGRTNYAPAYDGMRVLASGRYLSTAQRLLPFVPTAGILVEF